jgi:hypothetical protein
MTGNSANNCDYLKFKMPVRSGHYDNSSPQRQKTVYATAKYRVSINSFPDYKYLFPDNYVEYRRSTC